MVGSSLSFLMESFSSHSAYGLLMESLYGVSKYLAGKTVDEVTKKTLIEPVLKKILPKWGEAGENASTVTKVEFSERFTEYLERNNRAVETTLRCLEQLTERIEQLDRSVNKPIFLALGLPLHSNEPPPSDRHVQSILNDHAPGLPQSIKSGYALLHLRRGNRHLAELYARSTLTVSPIEPKAWYALGILKLQTPIVDISPSNADEAERCLATASEAGLRAQCAMPRAALRVDHYLRKGRPQPNPSLQSLGALFGKHFQEATVWPYGHLNDRLQASVEFRRLWKGR